MGARDTSYSHFSLGNLALRVSNLASSKICLADYIECVTTAHDAADHRRAEANDETVMSFVSKNRRKIMYES